MFADRVKIYVRGGRGGKGCASFLRARFNPRGGPDGGNGGRGGDVIIRVKKELYTLIDIKYLFIIVFVNNFSPSWPDHHHKLA